MPDADACSIVLLSRVFSLLKVLTLGLEESPPELIITDRHLDFDLALFSTYVATFQRSMRFTLMFSISYWSQRRAK